jgi:hypothetical protein
MKSGKYFWLLAIAFFTFQLSNAEVEFHGYMMNHSAFRVHSPYDVMLLRNRLRLNSELMSDNVYAYASVDFLNDAVIGDSTALNLREAYLDIYSSWVDFRIGKQQVVWGKADGYFINDIVNPLDLSLFLLQDFEDIRMATTMLNTKIHHGNNSLEVLVIPEFKPMKLDYSGNWGFNRPDSLFLTGIDTRITAGLGINSTGKIPITYYEDKFYKRSLRNFEYGLKLNTFLLGTDVSLIYLKAREDKPVMHKKFIMGFFPGPDLYFPIAVFVTPTHPWFTFYGANFSRPFGAFVLRGEGGYYPQRYFDFIPSDLSQMNTGLLKQKPFLQGMLGMDYQLTSQVDLSVQSIQERILDYEEAIMTDEVNTITSLMLRGSFANDTVLPLWLMLYNISNKSYLSRVGIDWKYSDSFTITVGADILGGDKETTYGQFNFGQFDKNDNLYLKLVFGF